MRKGNTFVQNGGPERQICNFPTLFSVDTEVVQPNNIVFKFKLKVAHELARGYLICSRGGGGGR